MLTTDNALQRFRSDKDHFFAHAPESPLSAEQQRAFTGLDYFDENLNLKVRATVDRTVEQVDGEPTQVTLYASGNSDELFVPFRDATSGRESYGAGRYLDVHAHGDDVTIDFNYAYNPTCAYDPSWSCPLPPAENWLKVPIRAGEKTFGEAAH
jgi:uncharacterized protein (DUF1684 family)